MSSVYMHGVGQAEQQRLEAQADLLGGGSFLPPLRSGMRLLELGCGTGAIARRIAAEVAPGEVVGVDREVAQLQAARASAAQERVTNVSFVRGAGEDLRPFRDAFDGAYCRFVLEHVSDPVLVLGEMARSVKTGGWVCAYEWQNSSCALFPVCPSLEMVWQAVYRLQGELGGDAHVAMKLPALFRAAGLRDLRATAHGFTFTKRDERLPRYVEGGRKILEETRDQLLARGFATEEQLRTANDEYARLLADPDALVIEVMCCVTGYRH